MNWLKASPWKINRGLSASLIIFGTAVFLGWGFWLLDQKGFFNLTQIEILVEEMPTQKVLLKSEVAELQEEIETLRGQSLWHLPLGTLVTQLQKKILD